MNDEHEKLTSLSIATTRLGNTTTCATEIWCLILVAAPEVEMGIDEGAIRVYVRG